MAVGDVTVFEESKAYLLNGDFLAADDIKVAICDNTLAPTAALATPTLGDFTEVGTAGSYVAGGVSIGALSTLVSEAGGVMTFDSATNPSWVQNGSNDVDAHWGIIYNDTEVTDKAIAYVELGGPVNMATGSLTITWAGAGIFTIT